MSEFPGPEESPFEHPNGNTYVWNGWAWEIEGESNDYATEEYVDGADVVVGEEANTYTDYHVSQAHKSAIEQANSYTDEQVAGIEIPEVPPLPDDLVTQDDLEGLATEEYVDTAIDGIEIPPLPDDLVHQPDLVGLASEAYVDSAIDAIPEVEIPEIPEIPSIEGLATVEYSDEMDAEVLDTAKRYADSVVKIEAGDNEVAQTYLQNPDIGAGGYQMTYWYSGAESAGGEIDASNIKNKKY